MINFSSRPGATTNVPVTQILALFTRLLSLEPCGDWPQTCGRRRFYDRVWSPLVTLWYVLWQRLQEDHTLDAVVKDARAGGADALTPGRRQLSQRIVSRTPVAFSKARRRLPLPWLRQAFHRFTHLLRAEAPGLRWHDWEVGLLDGSTFRLRPHGNIGRRFRPASNQHGPAYWCLVRVVVAFCAGSGLALATGLGPMSVSEQTLAVTLLLRATADMVWVGDRNFGIWRIARAAVQAHSHVLVRLTQERARRLGGRALRPGLDQAVCWTPSRQDQADPGLAREPVPGRLLALVVRRPGFRDQWLYLFTTLTDPTLYPATELLALYGLRWHVELNLRHLKAQMNLDQLEVKSARGALQQWYAGLLAYNLIRGVMLWAGATAGLSPLQLSFAQTRRLVIAAVRRWQEGGDPSLRRERWTQLLAEVAATLPPRRKKPRLSEPRAKYHVREMFPPLHGSRAAARLQLLDPPTKC
jgi:hypothetical protein